MKNGTRRRRKRRQIALQLWKDRSLWIKRKECKRKKKKLFNDNSLNNESNVLEILLETAVQHCSSWVPALGIMICKICRISVA